MKNLENQLKSYFGLLTIIGIFPLSVEKELVQSTILKLYGILIMAVQLGAGAYVMTKELPHPGFGGFALRSLPAIGMLIIGASTIVPIVNSNIICEIFERFNKVDRYFQELGISIRAENNVYKLWGMVILHLTISAVIVAFEFIFPFWLVQITYYAWYFYWLVTVMTFVVINIGAYSELLRERYCVINRELKLIEKEVQGIGDSFPEKMTLREVRPASNNYDTFERELFPPCINRIHQLTKTMKKHQDPRKNLITRIKKLQKCHFELSEICGNLGTLFTPSIVFTILFTGVELLITSYTAFKMILDKKIMMIALWASVKWVLVDFFRVLSILQAFSLTEKEANSTPSHVHAVLLEVESPETQKELIKFSQQLSHQKINFSTCGFFSLDMGLLVSMTGAITTYLVILLQYDSSNQPHSSDSPSA